MKAWSIRNAVAAVVLTAAVATAGTACGSGDETPDNRGGTPAAETARTPPPTAEGEKAEPERDGPAEDPPTVPRAELTPATGSFTKKQQEYLVDRVPHGTDPAAVLEAGQAVCDRITRTAEVDRKAAISALKSGEIADAESAVTHLCPRHKPLLEAAGLTGG